MKRLKGPYREVRAARIRTQVADMDRTLLVVESKELLEGQKRGIAVALDKAREEMQLLERLVSGGKITRSQLDLRVARALQREHLNLFVVSEIGGTEKAPTFSWRVDATRRRELERTRLGRRVLCTDHHSWRTERIVAGFRGQWNVEELFRRAKGGGIVPWGPSHQWADASLLLHTFATVLGLMLVSLARLALEQDGSTKAMMQMLGGIDATLIQPRTGKKGRPPTIHVRPKMNAEQLEAVEIFELARWMPSLSSSSQRTMDMS
jgi:transposase